MPGAFPCGSQLPLKSSWKIQRKDTQVSMKAAKTDKVGAQDLRGLGKYKHFCAVCKKVFAKKIHLEDHYRSKHGGPKLQCQYCPKAFTAYRSLELHTPLHTGKYPFHCYKCNAGFNLRRELEAHKNMHQGRGYTCLNCNRAFYVERDLFKHQEECAKPYEDFKSYEDFK